MDDLTMIPYFAHEGEVTRLERINKRWFIAFLIVLVMLFVTNAGWIYYESQFVEVATTVTQDVDSGEGTALVSGTGDIIYGESQTDDHR